MNKEEFNLQTNVCQYINLKYPNVFYRSDLAGIKMSIGQAVKIKKIQKWKSWPDLFIVEPAKIQSLYFRGLFIEIKTAVSSVYKQNSNIRTSGHIQEQYWMLLELRKRGFRAIWGLGWEHIIEEINNYLKCRLILL